MNSRLQDLSIVVVGGTTGMGLAAAKALVAEGAKLVVSASGGRYTFTGKLSTYQPIAS